MAGGYIKLFRDIMKWEWWSDINTYRVFTYLLLEARWEDSKYKGVNIPRGSVASSISEISTRCNLTIQQTRTSLSHLESTGEVTRTSHPKFTVFTVNNYDLFQDDNKITNNNLTSNQHANQQATNKQTNKQLTSNQHATNKLIEEERKNIKNIKKKEGKNIYFPNDEKLNAAFIDYLEMRKKIKKPVTTSKALTLCLNKVERLSNGDNDIAIEILNQSIMNSWQGLFELKTDYRNDRKPNASSWEDA